MNSLHTGLCVSVSTEVNTCTWKVITVYQVEDRLKIPPRTEQNGRSIPYSSHADSGLPDSVHSALLCD